MGKVNQKFVEHGVGVILKRLGTHPIHDGTKFWVNSTLDHRQQPEKRNKEKETQ